MRKIDRRRQCLTPFALRLLFVGAAFFAFVMAILPQPPAIPGQPSDKLLHILAFTVLGAVGAFAWPRLAVMGLVVGLAVFGAVIELVQTIPMLHRHGDWVDWLADVGAAAVAATLARWVSHRQLRS